MAPDDEVELAKALIEAINRPSERRRRGERSLTVARTSFHGRPSCLVFEAIYDDLRRQVPD